MIKLVQNYLKDLAETGVTFDRFYVSPVCAPTRAELLTGRYHLRDGIFQAHRLWTFAC